MSDGLRDPLLAEFGVAHAFGTRDAAAPPGLARARQVHGTRVVRADVPGAVDADADALVTRTTGVAVGVVTADCVPLLAVAGDGAVAAIHAGWRGLAAGVIAAGLDALRALADVPAGAEPTVAIGPHVGACCYEIDTPVIEAMTQRFGNDAARHATREVRQGHWLIDLAALVREELARCGVDAERASFAHAECTACDARRFHSVRRDGAVAGRLLHWIAPRGSA